ncbi:MAG: hypothetical protein KatS3mg003_1263 [Candidatus Nitrosocaldaceae archaeon]|nr:MAG: hypothetical protein KatS3mg003_0704 [Candidatus Nitrosocaldaceae archaeon]GIU71784.1 MAG: hypothetical protein KatS3mg003_1263 [Candidatus Nitrosocaldaceae archaeon]
MANVNLQDPENVKEYIAKRDDWSEGRKMNVVTAYDRFAKKYKIEWDKPKIRREETLPYIPTEREIDDLIAGCSKYVAVMLQIIKETAARSSESFNLRWSDIDLERKIIYIKAKVAITVSVR